MARATFQKQPIRPSPQVDPENWAVQVFYDGACPLCRREVNLLRRLDRKSRLRLTDISRPDFDAAAFGTSQEILMDQMHARLPDGSWVRGVDAFRRIYGAIGFRWLMPLTRLPLASHALEWGYQRFARNRLKWTGRCTEGQCELPAAATKRN